MPSRNSTWCSRSIPDNNKTAESLLYKGRALVKMPGHKTEGANEFMEVIKRYPKSDQSTQACTERKALGLNCGRAGRQRPRQAQEVGWPPSLPSIPSPN